ncbi:unnamed protein product, partial [Didymodactylos carnosus]
ISTSIEKQSHSILTKFDLLASYVAASTPILVAVTGSWLNNNDPDSHVSTLGYQSPICKDRLYRARSGLLIYARNDVKVSPRTDFENNPFETCFLNVRLCYRKSFLIGVRYRSKEHNIANFVDYVIAPD